ncbi:MAG: hypothetical protein JNL54_05410 [Kineosporiaceae bacterium]|nr:hypothetical protein [Kineosporiaceae bacterium]
MSDIGARFPRGVRVDRRWAAGPVSQDGARDLAPATVVLLWAFGALTALAVLSLLGGASRTADLFAWPIRPPLAAAAVGAGYGAGCVLVLLTLRDGRWAVARRPLATIWVFTVFTLVASVAHLHRLHLHEPAVLPRVAAWFWLLVYVVVPPVMLWVMIAQERRAAGDRAGVILGRQRLPRLASASLGVHCLVLAAAGVSLYLNLAPVMRAWPWSLTPFMAQVTGAWLIAFSLAALLSMPADPRSLLPAAAGYTAFGLLELLVLALHPDDVRPGPVLIAHLVLMSWVVLVGVWGMALAARREPAGAAGST